MTAFINVRVFDGVSDALSRPVNVFTKGNRIEEISERPPAAVDGAIIDGTGRTLMPGLIDAHVHVMALSVNVHEINAAPPSLGAAWAGRTLRRMLDRGFTTVRDVGGADYGLALALQRGYVIGPRLYYCGAFLSQTGGHGDMRDPFAEDSHGAPCSCAISSPKAAIVDGVDAVRRAVRENLRRGASFIKFMASGGVSSTGDSLRSIQFSDAEVLAIVDEVERHGAYCTAHIHPDAALRRAVMLGVHCIEHGTLIEPDTAQLVAERGVFVVPTLAIVAGLAQRGRELGYPAVSLEKLAQVKDEAIGRLKHLKDAGVRVGFGTDLLGTLESLQCTEFALRAEVFSAHEILVQATSNNAALIGAEGRLGVVKVGALADLLLVDGDPLRNLQVLAADGANLAAIMRDGVLHKCDQQVSLDGARQVLSRS